MSDKYAALKQAAEKAIAEEGGVWWDQALLTCYPDTVEIPAVEADFIEAASPTTILELLAERDADRARIAELEAREVKVKQFSEFQICHYGASEDYAKGYIDCQKNYNKALGAASILVSIGGED